jgi:hypothetical protein
MAWTSYDTPGEWFGAGYVLASSAISFNTATAVTDVTLPELTDAEANASTGDVRKVIFAIMEQLYTKYNSLATADKPTKMTISKSSSINTSTGIVTNTYTIRLLTSIVSQEVVAEG